MIFFYKITLAQFVSNYGNKGDIILKFMKKSTPLS